MLRSTPAVLLAVTAAALLSLLTAVELGRLAGLVCVLVLSSALALVAHRLSPRRR